MGIVSQPTGFRKPGRIEYTLPMIVAPSGCADKYPHHSAVETYAKVHDPALAVAGKENFYGSTRCMFPGWYKESQVDRFTKGLGKNRS